MADRNFQEMDGILMQELTRMFPNVSGGMIMDTLMRHNNQRDKCIEDLSLSCAGHCNVSSDNSDRYNFGNRSQSVSGVPGDTFNNNHLQYRNHCPQSAPVLSGHVSPFSEIRLSYNNPREALPSYTSTSSRFVQRPPVPPPTYRSCLRHEFNPGNQPYPYVNHPNPEQQVRHISSLTIAPIRPLPPPPPYQYWNSPSNGREINPPVRINTWGLSGINSDSPKPSLPYQSQLHISISPEGECIGASQPANSYTPPLNVNWFSNNNNNRFLQPGHYAQRPATSPQNSPRNKQNSPQEPFQPSLVDMEFPEQRRITQVPLQPASSPLPNYVDRAPDFQWPAVASGEEISNNASYTKDLIAHQKQKFGDVQKEVRNMQIKIEEELRDLMLLESQYFRKQHNPRDHLYFTFQDLQNLRAEVRCLMVGCENMTRLVDLLHKGEVPLGETAEEFYRSINTGQEGPVLLIKSNKPQPGPTRRQAELPQPSVSPNPSSQLDFTIPIPAVIKAEVEDEDDDAKWACCACTFLNNSSLGVCEICDMPKFVQGKTNIVLGSNLQSSCYCHANVHITNCCAVGK